MSQETVVGLMGVFVSALGVLFAAGAIVAGYAIFRQTQDFRRTLDDTVTSYRTLLIRSVDEANKRVDALSTTVAGQIEAAKRELERAGTEDRRRIDSEIDRLTALREAVDLTRRSYGPIEAADFVLGSASHPAPPMPVPGMMETAGKPAHSANGLIMCKNCKNLFSPRAVAFEPPNPIRCPYCNKLNSWVLGT